MDDAHRCDLRRFVRARSCINHGKLRSTLTRSGAIHLCAEADRARAFAAFIRVVEPHREGELENVRLLKCVEKRQILDFGTPPEGI